MSVLIDMREMACVPPPGRGPYIAGDVNTWLPDCAIAMVATDPTLFGVARQVCVLVGQRAQAFTNVDEAKRWLLRT